MRKRKAKKKVLVRQWIPRRVTPIPLEQVQKTLKEAQPKLKAVLYVGWQRRVMNGKRMLQYVIATGNTTKEARQTFKKSENVGEDIWIIP